MIRYRSRLSAILLILLITSLFCIGLYQFNNKYTHNSIQPSYGQLKLSENDLESCHYLIDDWAFYPNVLLTPEELHGENIEYAMNYTSIGERTRFDTSFNDDNPHGCGTYAMHLWLPENTDSYTLELPEIFSSYRLYINGEAYLQMGNPQQDNYLDRTQTKLVTFRANEHVELIIAVSDFSHFYSGMVYPPMIGTSSKVMQMHELRQSVTLFTVSIGFLLTGITLYLALKMKKHKALLFSFLSFVMCLTILFPYIHTIVELPVFPWYTLELLCIYLMPLLTIILHNRICDTSVVLRKVSVSIAAAVCFIACCYGISSSTLSIPVMRIFSTLVFVYKVTLAIYLLVTAFFALEENTRQVRLLYYASIAYAGIFLWDRILPAYEPIAYGWFADFGNLILVISIGYTLVGEMIQNYLRSLSFAEEHRQMTKQLAMQDEYSRQLSEQSERHRRVIHDFRQHLRTISMLAERIEPNTETADQQKELITYIKEISDIALSQNSEAGNAFSKNPAVDALMQYYYNYAKQRNIDVDFQWIPSDLKLSDVELCTILGNLLENAIDACHKLPKEAVRNIKLYARETEHLLFLRIENTYDGFFIKKDHRLLSRKPDTANAGIGMGSVREIVERYNGTLDSYPMEHIFRVGISLPLK